MPEQMFTMQVTRGPVSAPSMTSKESRPVVAKARLYIFEAPTWMLSLVVVHEPFQL
jgi:hypothetical protein